MENKAPSGEKLLATLIELYADQMGIVAEFSIESGDGKIAFYNTKQSCGATIRNADRH